jgi:hypothetical protein
MAFGFAKGIIYFPYLYAAYHRAARSYPRGSGIGDAILPELYNLGGWKFATRSVDFAIYPEIPGLFGEVQALSSYGAVAQEKGGQK